MNLGKKARNVASITNRPTCGGSSKAGLAPSIGAAYTGLYMNASMRRAISKIDWPVHCQDAIDAGMPLSKNPACSGGVGNVRSRRYCRCSKCSAPRGTCPPEPQLLPVYNLQAWYVLPTDPTEYAQRRVYKPVFSWTLPSIDKCQPPSGRWMSFTLLEWRASATGGVWKPVPGADHRFHRYTNSTALGWSGNWFPELEVGTLYRIWVTIEAHYDNFAPQRASTYIDFPPFADGRTDPYPTPHPHHQTIPSPPLDLAGSGNQNSVNLTWEPPLSNGGALITSYIVKIATSEQGPFRTVLTDINPSARSALVLNLDSDTTYWFQVAAVNSIGIGQMSTPASVKTAHQAGTPQPPSAPTDFVGVALTQAAYLSWDPPDDTGGFPLKHYQLRRTEGGNVANKTFEIKSSEQSSPWAYYDSPLDSTLAYTYEVRVQNSGTSTWSPWAGLPAITPLPTPVTPSPPDPPVWYGTNPVTAGAGTLRGQWTSPADPGSYPVTQFTMQVSTSKDDWSAAKSTILLASTLEYPYSDTIDGLTGETLYYARVKAQSRDTQTGVFLDSAWTPVQSATTSVSCACPADASEWNGAISTTLPLPPRNYPKHMEWGAKIIWTPPATTKYQGCVKDWELKVYKVGQDGNPGEEMKGSGLTTVKTPIPFYILNSTGDKTWPAENTLLITSLQQNTTYFLQCHPQPNLDKPSVCPTPPVLQHKFTTGSAAPSPPPTDPCQKDLTTPQVWVGTVRSTPQTGDSGSVIQGVQSAHVSWNLKGATHVTCVKNYVISIYDSHPIDNSGAQLLLEQTQGTGSGPTGVTNFTIADDTKHNKAGWVENPYDSHPQIPLANIAGLTDTKHYFLQIQAIQENASNKNPQPLIIPFSIGGPPTPGIPTPSIPTGAPHLPQTYVTTYGIPSWGNTAMGGILGNGFYNTGTAIIEDNKLDTSLNMIQSWAMVRQWSRQFFGDYKNFILANDEITNAMILVGDWAPVLPAAGLPVQRETLSGTGSDQKYGTVAGSNVLWDILKANYSYCSPNGPVDFGLPYSCPSVTDQSGANGWAEAVQAAWPEEEKDCAWLGCPLILDFLLPLAVSLRDPPTGVSGKPVGQTGTRIVGISVNGDVSKQGGDGAYYSLDCGNYAQQDLRITGSAPATTNLLTILDGGNNEYYSYPEPTTGFRKTAPRVGAWGGGWYQSNVKPYDRQGKAGIQYPLQSQTKKNGYPVTSPYQPTIDGTIPQVNPSMGKIQTIRLAMSQGDFNTHFGSNPQNVVFSQNNAAAGFGTTTLFFDACGNPLAPGNGANGLLSAKYVSVDPLPKSVYKDSKGYGEFVVEIQFSLSQGYKRGEGAFTVTDTNGKSGMSQVYLSTYNANSNAYEPQVPKVDPQAPWVNLNVGDNPSPAFPCTYADPCPGQFDRFWVLQQNDPGGTWALPPVEHSPNGIATKDYPYGIMGQVSDTMEGSLGGASQEHAASGLTINLAPGVKPEWIQDASLNTVNIPEPLKGSMTLLPARKTPNHKIYYVDTDTSTGTAWDATQPIPPPPTAGTPQGTAPNQYTNPDKIWPVLIGSFDDPPAPAPVKTPWNYTTAPLSSTGVNAGSTARALWGGSDPSGTPNAVPSTGGWLNSDWNTVYRQAACFPAYWNVSPASNQMPIQPGGTQAKPEAFPVDGGLVKGGGNVFIGNGIGAYTGRGAYFDPTSVETNAGKYDLTKPPTLVTISETGTGEKGTFFTYEGSKTASWSPDSPVPGDASGGAIGFPLDNLHQQYILLYRINQKIMEFNWKCAQQALDPSINDYGINSSYAKKGDPLVIPYIGHVHHDKESYQVNKTPLYPVCNKMTGELSTAWLLGDDTGDESNVPDLISAIRSYSPEAYLIWKQNRRQAGVAYEKYLYNRYMPAEFLPDWRVGGKTDGDNNPSHYLPHNSGCMIPCTGNRTPDGFSQTDGEILWDPNKPWNTNQQRNFGTEPSSTAKADKEQTGVPDPPPLPTGLTWTENGGVGNYSNDLRSRMLENPTPPTASHADGIQRYPMGWVNYKVECWAHAVPFGQSAGPDASVASGATDSGVIVSKVDISGNLGSVAPNQLFVQHNTLASGTVYDVSNTTLELCIKQGDSEGKSTFNDEEMIDIYTNPTTSTPETFTPIKSTLRTAAERYTSQGHNEAYQELYNIGEVKPPFADAFIYDAEPKTDQSGKAPPPSPSITVKAILDGGQFPVGSTVTYDGNPKITGWIDRYVDKSTVVFEPFVVYGSYPGQAYNPDFSGDGKVTPKDDLGGKGTFPDAAKVTITAPGSTGTSTTAYIASSYWPTSNAPFPSEFIQITQPPDPTSGTRQEYGTLQGSYDGSGVLFELPPPPTAAGQQNYIPNGFGSACVPGENAPSCPSGKSVFCPDYKDSDGKDVICSNPTGDSTCYAQVSPPPLPTCCAVGPYYKLNAVTNTLISRVYDKYTCNVIGEPIGEPNVWRQSFLGNNAVVENGSSPALTDIWLRGDTGLAGQAILPLDGRGTTKYMDPSSGSVDYPGQGWSQPVTKQKDTDGVYSALQSPYINLSNGQIELSGMYGIWDPNKMPRGPYPIPVPDDHNNFLPPQGPRQAIALFANEFIGGALTARPDTRPGNNGSKWQESVYGVFKPSATNPNKDVWPPSAPPELRRGPKGLVPGPVPSWTGSRCMEVLVFNELIGSSMNQVMLNATTGTNKDQNGKSASPFTVDLWRGFITGPEPEPNDPMSLRQSWIDNGWSYEANAWGGEYNGLSSLQDKRDAVTNTGRKPTGYGLMREFLAACASMQAGIRDGSGSVLPESLHQARAGLYTIGFIPEFWLSSGHT